MSHIDVLEGRANWHVEHAPRAMDVLRALPAASVDVIPTDPPYATTGESTAWVSKDKVRSLPRETQFYEAWIREYLAEFRRILKPTGGIWMSCDWAAAMAIDQACPRVGLRAPTIGVWDREGLGMGHVLRHVYECFAVITMPEWERIYTDEPDVWRCKWTPSDRTMGHSAEKPVPLMARAIRLLARPGGVALDPFSGSGTTGVAALREGLRYIGIERDDGFVVLQRDRLAAEQMGSDVKAKRSGQEALNFGGSQ